MVLPQTFLYRIHHAKFQILINNEKNNQFLYSAFHTRRSPPSAANIITPGHWALNHSLKAVDTIGNCQRLACTVGVSQHMHKITNLWKFELNRSSNLRDNKERKNTLVTQSFVRLDGWFQDLKF